ncbi:sensor domain-containing diguanylate cyclase [Comamonas testosteroni]|uniref:sensor domain-containing diguanylate cyclase n=1 Tax=Comamonas testosteroni TaxID=285 RepID=UPI0015F91B30|nr:sensor domain-containing diguanylate cyclase [Comamonas testosteroni]
MFDRLSIRHKLIVLLGLSAALALLTSSIIAIYSTYVSESKASLRVLHQISAIVSENMRAALAFSDSASARNMLAPLHADPHILFAAVNDESGQTLAEHRSLKLAGETEQLLKLALQDKRLNQADKLGSQEHFVELIEENYMSVRLPIVFEGKSIGSLVLVSDTELLWTKIRNFIYMQITASIVTLVMLLFLSLRWRALFTQPITDLISAMQTVAATKNYHSRLNSRRRDEFDDLYQGFNAMLAEISERDERLSKLATTDPLTGLANRRHAIETMRTMATRAYRKREALGVIMLDIDFFKHVNDRYGHPVGDKVIREIASILQASAREYDLAARFGGEEFIVLCDGGTSETTVAVAERIRLAVEERRIEYAPGEFMNVSVSLGVFSTTPQENNSIEQWIYAADQALYRAKNMGRNRHALA